MITHIWIFRIISILKYYFALLSFLFNVIKNALFSSLPFPKNNNSMIFPWIGGRDYTYNFFWEESKKSFLMSIQHMIFLYSVVHISLLLSQPLGGPVQCSSLPLIKNKIEHHLPLSIVISLWSDRISSFGAWLYYLGTKVFQTSTLLHQIFFYINT